MQLQASIQQANEAYKRGALGEAEAILRGVLKSAPNASGALQLLSMVLMSTGRLDEARPYMEKSVRVSPQDPVAWNNLGNLRRECRDPLGALSAYEEATGLDPDYTNALHNLASLHMARSDCPSAIAALRRLTALEPKDPQVWNLLGVALSDNAQVDLAIEALEHAVSLAPQWPKALHNLGVALNYAGRGEDARRAFMRALELDPSFARAWESLVRSHRLGAQDRPLLARMGAMLEQAVPGSEARVVLHFALGKGHDDLEEFDLAFEHYQQGNRAMRRVVQFDLGAKRRELDVVTSLFDRRFFEERVAWGSDSVQPVFILGMPRSGSTLIEQILAAHPDVYAAGELQLIPQIVSRLAAESGGFVQAMQRLSAEDIQALASQVLSELAALGANRQRIVDKLPGNYLHIGLIRLLLPRATILHSQRDPFDTCLSIYFQRFAHGHEFAYDLAEIGEVYGLYKQLMKHWQRCLHEPPRSVSYEDVVDDPERAAQRILDWVGLDYDPALIERVGRAGVVKTASSWQVRQPISSNSVQRWRHYERHLGPLRAALGEHPDKA